VASATTEEGARFRATQYARNSVDYYEAEP
jgi:hypothetical protein